ncbi:MAG TPA: hypothetical protein PKA00_02660 [Saprospiraceae bacterium]|nr:hypothetical protein [Saprospiraceae bacterium]HMQ81775.1 hypothetical protein [Saprospiraceae bacterium]
MLIFTYTATNPQVREIIEKLEQLSLAHQVIQEDGIGLRLQEGNKVLVGFESIKTHLEELEGELKRWYYCGC